ncbi:hypothetical protein M758_UG188200 [Ceratodon purpureus]|nr:hypothetical protein M758_UG188200 [Ceratodon purpureus]
MPVYYYVRRGVTDGLNRVFPKHFSLHHHTLQDDSGYPLRNLAPAKNHYKENPLPSRRKQVKGVAIKRRLQNGDPRNSNQENVGVVN